MAEEAPKYDQKLIQQIQLVPLKDLKPYEKNPRYIHDADFEALKRSLREDPEMLEIRTIVVSGQDGQTIIGGNQRYHALKAIGAKEAPVIISRMSPDKERRFVIRDNVNNGEWDYEILAENYSKDELEEMGWEDDRDNPEDWEDPDDEDEKEIVEDMPPDVPEDPVSQLGEIYKLGDHFLACGSATDEDLLDEIISLIPTHDSDEAQIAMIFTDPPYGVDYKSDKFGKLKNDNLSEDGTYALHRDAFNNALRHSTATVGVYCWHASRYQATIEKALNDAGITVKQQLIWSKGFNLGRDHHHWAHEPCFYCHRTGKQSKWYGGRDKRTVLEYAKGDIDKLPKDDLVKLVKALREETTVWHFQKDSIATLVHATQKPVTLSARAMANSSRAGEIVLDCFAGSGSTLMGAEQMGRRAIAIELDPKYADVIRRRYYRYVNGLMKDDDDSGWEEATAPINTPKERE